MSGELRRKTKGKKPRTCLSTVQIADQHLGKFENLHRKGEFGRGFFHLSSALYLLPSIKDTYYSSFLEVFDSWSAVVEESKGFEEAVKLYELALKHYPDSADIKYLLSKILYSIMSHDIWRALFRECLSGHGSQYCDEVAPLLIAVDHGIKPSLLWDVCTADTSALLSLLNQAQTKGLLVSKLALVELDLDVLIVNVDALTHTLSTISSGNPTWLIDISEATPKVSSTENHQKFHVHLNSIITQLEVVGLCNTKNPSASNTRIESQGASIGGGSSSSSSSSGGIKSGVSSDCTTSNLSAVKAVQVKLPRDINLSTVFGCMLGYPHIYWWEGDSDGKSLSGMPLKVFKFSADCTFDGSLTELFSFSIPEAMEHELRPGIERWGNVMNTKVEEASSFSNAKFRCDSVLCLSVAL